MNQNTLSQSIYAKLCEVIPGGVNSPVRSCMAMGQTPLVAISAKGDMIYDVDGKGYIDYCGSWGPMIHGHAHPDILAAVHKRIDLGTSFGVTTPIEEELAREVIKAVPSVEKIRFVSSGTEATMSAARLARGFTGRDMIVKFTGHYHGHADFFLIQAGSGVTGLTPTSSSAGIPADFVRHTLCLPFNDCDALKALFNDPEKNTHIAAVILEPIAGNMGLISGEPEFMRLLRELTQQNGTVLIYDEVMTGFRVAYQGAQSLYGITPDLTTFGKVIGGGFPAAAFGGRREIMDCLAPLGTVYQAGTLSGNPVAMEAGLQSLRLLQRPGFYEELERKSRLLAEPIQDYLFKNNKNACVQRVGSMLSLFFGRRSVRCMEEAKELDFDTFARFFRYMFANGVYIPPAQQEAWFVSMAHTDEHLEQTRDLILDFISDL